jgi:predicted DNA-binding protein
MDNKSHNISVRFDTSTYTILSDIATQTETPLSYVIRKIIRDHLRSTGKLHDTVAPPATKSVIATTSEEWEV